MEVEVDVLAALGAAVLVAGGDGGQVNLQGFSH
jgi:hypothetical protein